MVPSGGDLMEIRNEWAHGRNIMVNTSSESIEIIWGDTKLHVHAVYM